jgi:gamma-glutamyltranspeptidase / glutathione hydrolase
MTQDPNDVKTSTIMIEDCYGGRGEIVKQADAAGLTIQDDGEYVAAALRGMGHQVEPIVKEDQRSVFGRGQVIVRSREGVLAGGSDPRADGCAIPCLL